MDIQITTWQNIFFSFLLVGILLLVLFRLLRYILPVFFKDHKQLRQIIKVMPLIETAGWLLFFSWYTFRFAEIKSLYALVIIGILLVLVFWITRYLTRDLIAGMIFRVSGRFNEGDIIIHDNRKGIIKKFRFDTLEVESTDGQIIYIPFGELQSGITIKGESTDQTAAYSFLLECRKKNTPEETITNIRNYLISLPWSSVQKMPLVVIREQSEALYLIDVTVYPVEKPFAKKIETLTIEKFQD